MGNKDANTLAVPWAGVSWLAGGTQHTDLQWAQPWL